MPGPLPNPQRRRRNKPTIPTTTLPVSGRRGRPPNPPEAYPLKKAGKAWWKWAWTSPQATAWDSGAFYAIARRAQLEDDLAICETFDEFDLAGFLGVEENEAIRELQFIIGRLKGLATGRVSLMKEMRELDKKLGLDPESMAKLRWKIVPDEKVEDAEPRSVSKKSARKGRPDLRVVDTALVASG